MYRLYYIFVFLLLFGSNHLLAQGQVDIRVDSTNFLIGDAIKMQIIVNLPLGNKVAFPDIQALLKKEEIEVLDISPEQATNQQNNTTIQQELVITAWEPKTYTIPVLTFTYQKQGATQEIKSNSLLLTVSSPSVTGDTTYVADIKNIIIEKATFWDKFIAFLMHPLVAAFGLLLILGLLIWAIIQYKNKRNIAKQKPPSPEELALEQLKELEANNPLKKGDYKAFHTEISFILRTYLSGRFEVKALETPIIGILPQIEGHQYLNPALYQELSIVLEHANLIKFAKASPLDLANKKALDLSYNLIESIQEQKKEALVKQ